MDFLSWRELNWAKIVSRFQKDVKIECSSVCFLFSSLPLENSANPSFYSNMVLEFIRAPFSYLKWSHLWEPVEKRHFIKWSTFLWKVVDLLWNSQTCTSNVAFRWVNKENFQNFFLWTWSSICYFSTFTFFFRTCEKLRIKK